MYYDALLDARSVEHKVTPVVGGVTYKFQQNSDTDLLEGLEGGQYTDRMLIARFESVPATLRHIREEMSEPKQFKSSSERKNNDGDDFHQFSTYEEAMDIFSSRPHEVVDYTVINAHMDTLKPLAEEFVDDYSETFGWDVTGEFIDVGAFLDGEPECFGSFVLDAKKEKFIDINVYPTCPWYISHTILNQHRLFILGLVKILERIGYSVAVKVDYSGTYGGFVTTVKDYEGMFNFEHMSIVTHPEFFRRMVFRFLEYSEPLQPGYGNGHFHNETTFKKMKRYRPTIHWDFGHADKFDHERLQKVCNEILTDIRSHEEKGGLTKDWVQVVQR